MRTQQRRADAAGMGQPIQRVIHRGRIGGTIDLGAVAGGENGRLHRRVACGAIGQRLAQTKQRRRDLIDRERKTTAHVKRRGRVIDA
ncbi:hypothetical protein SDC9_163144 [bioreactor metagenome]|uniref:Uncharacterized protein n=1 Tax=bioreactor metagenome TaxID=1076179 RepID=A0A645FMZ9_9ZZZZ